MTVGELQHFISVNNVPDDTEVCMETGIDVIVDVSHLVFNGVELIGYQSHSEEDIEI